MNTKSIVMVAAIHKMVEYLVSEKCISVLVPQEWKSIRGIEPIDFEVLPDIPTSYKPKVRPINGQLFKDVKAEFSRMKTYFYEKSQSPIASPLVVAPKGTALFIRLCGNYIWPNKFIKRPHFRYRMYNMNFIVYRSSSIPLSISSHCPKKLQIYCLLSHHGVHLDLNLCLKLYLPQVVTYNL
jgi:hypothetical protein